MGILCEEDHEAHQAAAAAVGRWNEDRRAAREARLVAEEAERQLALTAARKELVRRLIESARARYRRGNDATASIMVALGNSQGVFDPLVVVFSGRDIAQVNDEIGHINTILNQEDQGYAITHELNWKEIREHGEVVNAYVAGVTFTIQPRSES